MIRRHLARRLERIRARFIHGLALERDEIRLLLDLVESGLCALASDRGPLEVAPEPETPGPSRFGA